MKLTKDYRLEHIMAKDKEKPDRNKHIHVTDLSKCLSGVFYEKTGQSVPEMNDSKLRRFDAGHNIEERVIEAYRFAGVLKEEQVFVEWPEYNMIGSADAIIEEDGQLWLVEVKSIHNYGINYLYKDNQVHEHYIEQVMLYFSKLKEQYPDLKARIYYEALDGRTFEQEIEYNQEVVDKALMKATLLAKALEEGVAPEPPETYVHENGKWVLNWRVMYCWESSSHYLCEPDKVLDPDPTKQVNKLKYQATKLNK